MPSKNVLQAKQEQVHELAEKLKTAKGVVLADYRGLTVEQDTKLRKTLREAGVDYQVIKNSVIHFAALEANLVGLEPYLSGPTAVAISLTDPVAPSKLLTKFDKDFEKFGLKGGIVEGTVLDVDGVRALSLLPSKEQLISMMLGSLKSPLAGFVNVLNGNIRGLVVALGAIAEKKQEA
jgi:large subunit ribosomal protein L10